MFSRFFVKYKENKQFTGNFLCFHLFVFKYTRNKYEQYTYAIHIQNKNTQYVYIIHIHNMITYTMFAQKQMY